MSNKSQNQQYYYISYEFEYFLRCLYGTRNYHGFASAHSLAMWKKTSKRLSNTIEKTIELNVESDGFHKERINSAINHVKKATNIRGEIDHPEYIFALIKVIFLLLGDIPYHVNRKKVNRNKDWLLSYCRKLTYIQNSYQKANLILEVSRHHPYCETHKYVELRDKFYFTYGGNAKQFLEWYKNQYPEIYLKLF